MSKILVTGAGGYMGRHIVTSLLDKGADIIAVDFNIDLIDERADRRVVDIFSGDENLYEKLGKPDVCLHLAWKDGFVHNSDAHMEMLSSHYKFVKYMVESGCKQIAVMGTMHEVGYHEGEINEDTPCNPISLYGIAKDALRKSLIAYSQKNDFITVDELADQISSCVMQKEVTGIINCCSGKPVSLGEMVESFVKNHGYDLELQYGVFPDRPYDSPAIWGNSEKIEKIMNNRK